MLYLRYYSEFSNDASLKIDFLLPHFVIFYSILKKYITKSSF